MKRGGVKGRCERSQGEVCEEGRLLLSVSKPPPDCFVTTTWGGVNGQCECSQWEGVKKVVEGRRFHSVSGGRDDHTSLISHIGGSNTLVRDNKGKINSQEPL